MDVWRARPNLSFEPRSSVRLRTSSLTALHSIGPKHKPLQESHNKLLGRSLRVAREVWLRLLGRVLTTSRRHLAKWPTVLPSCLSTLRPHASHASIIIAERFLPNRQKRASGTPRQCPKLRAKNGRGPPRSLAVSEILSPVEGFSARPAGG